MTMYINIKTGSPRVICSAQIRLGLLMAFAFCVIWFCSTGFGHAENEDRTILNFLRPLQMPHGEPPPEELQTSKAWDAVILDESIVAGYKRSKSISRKNAQFDAILSEYQTENLKVITKQTVGVWAAEISIKTKRALLNDSNIQTIFNLGSEVGQFSLERAAGTKGLTLKIAGDAKDGTVSPSTILEKPRKTWRFYLRISKGENGLFVWTLKKTNGPSSAIISYSTKFNQVWFVDRIQAH